MAYTDDGKLEVLEVIREMGGACSVSGLAKRVWPRAGGDRLDAFHEMESLTMEMREANLVFKSMPSGNIMLTEEGLYWLARQKGIPESRVTIVQAHKSCGHPRCTRAIFPACPKCGRICGMGPAMIVE